MEGKIDKIDVNDVKTNLSKYLREVAEGKEIVIGRDGQPVAKLVPFVNEKPAYKFGLLKGQIQIAEDFDAPDERVTGMLECGILKPRLHANTLL